ncbi:sulfotransferase [Roseovarius salis]|uniref:sulfotransferase family protein n=1 Tax=Roseovarius salis TaxID=3376063 RepID=UPI0037CC646E
MMPQERKPNFFIVGAPKSGTTAMAQYLDEHDNVFVCKPKEPCFFCTDFPGQRLATSEEDYAALFTPAGAQHRAIGDGSVWYLYSKEAIGNIHRYDAGARIIVMLRNPVSQVYSMHQELYHRRYEVEPDFVKAWALQPTRRQGLQIPRYCREPRFLQYADIALYSGQIERLLDTFPRDQVRIVIFDDFKRDTGKVYRDLLEFLGVPDDGRDSFQPALQSRRHRFRALGTFLINQPPWLIRSRNAVKKAFGIERFGVGEFVMRHNTVAEKRKPLPDGFVSELKGFFRSDVDRLSDLLGRDLSHWCA